VLALKTLGLGGLVLNDVGVGIHVVRTVVERCLQGCVTSAEASVEILGMPLPEDEAITILTVEIVDLMTFG
jgi:hypothetical protein